ncbi:unnamed protein product [Psylliodes chrysocephalus]|uniref:Uncharacterized protein n=1 Tax=Psylliodes chrysocephalus TaxID=3402493 RepID=A0A9P0CST2_9CUCU|nr:unnamed protein product [Psylliodes chrysocephala]
MSSLEESFSEPFEDSGSEYELPTACNRRNKRKNFYIDDSSSDADVFFPVKHLRNLHQLDVQSKSSIPGTSKAANLNSPVKSDGPNSPDNLDDPNIPDYSYGQSTPVKKTRKRKANEALWKKNIRKRLRQSGEEYTSCRGKNVKARACEFLLQRIFREDVVFIKNVRPIRQLVWRKNVIPEKKWLYSNIFNYEFNLGFFIPKKDLCEVCTEYHSKKEEGTLNENLEEKYRAHIKAKLEAREEKLRDISVCKNYPSTALICFDMKSVLTCPQTQISKAYYKKKFAVYNLTGNDVVKKTGFCVLWHELLSGRKGVDIASALYILLNKFLLGRPDVTKLILWSDACVPQNKNSHMSAALLYFLKMHPEIQSIVQKFQVPGHSCVQEVDAMHSVLTAI